MNTAFNKLLILAFVGLSAFSLLAKDNDDLKHGGVGYFMLGIQTADFSELNSALQAAGYTEFKDQVFALGGAGHAVMDRFIIGGEGYALLQRDKRSGDFDTSLRGGIGLFNLGYMVYKRDHFWIYPLLGLGGGGINLNILEKTEIPSFEEVLENPKRGVELYSGGFIVQASLGMDFFLDFEKEKKSRGGLVISLRAGYGITPMSGDWYIDDMEITGGPDIGLTGPFVRLGIGGGGFGKD